MTSRIDLKIREEGDSINAWLPMDIASDEGAILIASMNLRVARLHPEIGAAFQEFATQAVRTILESVGLQILRIEADVPAEEH